MCLTYNKNRKFKCTNELSPSLPHQIKEMSRGQRQRTLNQKVNPGTDGDARAPVEGGLSVL